jgi:hypothetical protein
MIYVHLFYVFLVPLANLHYFLIFDFSLSFKRRFASCVLLSWSLVSDGNINFVYAFLLYVHSSVTRLANKTRAGSALEEEVSPLEEDVEVVNPWDFFL